MELKWPQPKRLDYCFRGPLKQMAGRAVAFQQQHRFASMLPVLLLLLLLCSPTILIILDVPMPTSCESTLQPNCLANGWL